MVHLKKWQWGALALPLVIVLGFLLVAAAYQIHTWRLNWIWAIFILMLVGWRWLLARWTRPLLARNLASGMAQLESAMAAAQDELAAATAAALPSDQASQQAEAALDSILQASQEDAPAWEDWPQFWARCQDVVTAVARAYHPEVKYPLLNIYIPQAYGLLRGTVDDMDRWMDQLSPVLGQVSVGQAVQAYDLYRSLEPSARKLFQVWNWAQWVLNPLAAAARTASQPTSDRATQQLLVNLSQLLREAALRNLYHQAVLLYSGQPYRGQTYSGPTSRIPSSAPAPVAPSPSTQTLQAILEQAEPVAMVEEQPVTILLVGRTGAGKSSLINTLFNASQAAVDVLPSTADIQRYQWQASTGATLMLLDSPGYEQVDRPDLRQGVLEQARQVDLILLVTPALDPALQMDVEFLQDVQHTVTEVPTIAIVTQVDRLRPIREWQPPYDWQWGDRPKEKAIREATRYRAEAFGEVCDRILPLVTRDAAMDRAPWNEDALALTLLERMDPARQERLARFLRQREARAVAATRLIDRYVFRMTTTQGLTAFLKSPVLQFLATLTTGTPALAYMLAQEIPVEQLPVVIGKLQMAYELYQLLQVDYPDPPPFDLLTLWPLLLDNPGSPDQVARAFGIALVEYWSQGLSPEVLHQRYRDHLAGTAR